MRTFEAFLVVADISGYTKFVVMNRSSIIHAEQIITELMETVTSNAELPLTVHKLEGDSVFMFAELGTSRRESINSLTRQVVNFMNSYQSKQQHLFQNSVGGCACSACQSIEKLHLKCDIHIGEVLEKQVEGRPELAGEPVIVVHRLMKNSIDADAYILATEPVSKELDFEPFPKHKKYEEKIADIGAVRIEAFFSKNNELDRANSEPYGWLKRNMEGLRLLFAWIYTAIKQGRAKFHNLP